MRGAACSDAGGSFFVPWPAGASVQRMRRTTLLLALSLLAGCEGERPPAPTTAEAEQLDEAESMLDAEAANAEGPEDRSPGPT